MINFSEGKYDVCVIGAGHAGCEAALACSRTGLKTIVLTINLDSIAYMACNPSIGGTAKGHLVREIDALGGEMAINADKTALQIRMLNSRKGPAVQSLRCQCDKNAYHERMKSVLESEKNLRILQGEAKEILVKDGAVCGVETAYGGVIECCACIICTGVYLSSRTITGDVIEKSGPNGFKRSEYLSSSLKKLGFTIKRFKTGTPARIHFRSIDLSSLFRQDGDEDIMPFSFMSDVRPQNVKPCYLAYTNEKTHEIIRVNLDRSPLYNGTIESSGPRYCPSIETKVVRFDKKERHQIFIEPEGALTQEAYIQGMSSSMPHDVQIDMYRSIKGLESAEFMRYAYAIEYDCIDTSDIYATLECKKVNNLYTAGQINGTSGYEEAAAQGLVAGLNASLKLRGKDQLVLKRDEAYIGVMIDDLITKGCEEPYRMMTSRAEHRVELRQDNADMRLTQKGRDAGLVTDERYERFLKRRQGISKAGQELCHTLTPKESEKVLKEYGYDRANGALSYKDLIRRGIPLSVLKERFGALKDFPKDICDTVETDVRYEGYIKKSREIVEKTKKLEDKLLPPDLNYSQIEGLRLEAREKLNKVRPLSLGQAGRIYGVNPADISVLMVYLAAHKNK